MIEISSILEQVALLGSRLVTVTGGEPLAQKNCLLLLQKLCDDGYQVSLETSGALSLEGVDSRVTKVMDIKTPASQESHRNYWANLSYLLPQDQIKFVICDRNDYDWAKEMLLLHDLYRYGEILFSPSYGQISPTLLADWILHDKLSVRFQIQLHKLLWGDERGK
jgi:7-carboxy-7-deazaguanine synthase